MGEWRNRAWTVSCQVAALGVLSVGCASQQAPVTVPPPAISAPAPSVPVAPPAPPSGSVAAGRPVALRYNFDTGVGGWVADSAGLLPLQAVTERGGELVTVPRAAGRALRFPQRCEPIEDSSECPRAILQSGPAGLVNPGSRTLRFGAAVRVPPDQVGPGANVLQKGFSTRGSQFKLQVDGGRASCVLADSAQPPKAYVAVARVSVVDGDWHALDCVRAGDSLTVAVDGTVRARVPVPPDLSIVNDEPLRVGGKGNGPDNDQFAGEIDDVYIVIY